MYNTPNHTKILEGGAERRLIEAILHRRFLAHHCTTDPDALRHWQSLRHVIDELADDLIRRRGGAA